MSEAKIIRCAFGTHPSTGKFYELLLVENANRFLYLIRRYGKAELVRQGGTAMTGAGGLSDFDALVIQKKTGGYRIVVGQLAQGSHLEKNLPPFGSRRHVSDITLHLANTTIKGEDYKRCLDVTPLFPPNTLKAAEEKPKEIASSKLDGWGGW